jgi:hypothetical protein
VANCGDGGGAGGGREPMELGLDERSDTDVRMNDEDSGDISVGSVNGVYGRNLPRGSRVCLASVAGARWDGRRCGSRNEQSDGQVDTEQTGQ